MTGPPQRVGTLSEGKEGKSHIAQAGERLCLRNQGGSPERGDFADDNGFKKSFGWRGDQDLEWIWKRVLVAQISHLCEPGVFDRVMENMDPMLVKGVRWA